MNPKVSVVIPTYNSAQFIVETLESVFAQTYEDYEIIVVDDGSTDNTREVLKPYMSRIRYIYKENGGASSARNLGIKSAEGEYIAFLDSDDLWMPEKLEKQMEYFQTNPDCGLVYSDCIRIDSDGVYLPQSDVYSKVSGYIFLKLLEGFVLPTSTVIAKVECFGIAGYFDENLERCEDYDLWLRIARFFTVGYTEGPLVKYRVRSHWSTQIIDKSHEGALVVLTRAVERFGDEIPDKEELLKNRVSDIYFNWGLSHFTRDSFKEARGKFAIAAKYPPRSRALLYYISTLLPYCLIQAIRKVKRKPS